MKSWTTVGGTRIARVAGGRSNAFLVSRGGRNLLIDATVRSGRGGLARALFSVGVRALDLIVLTHAHFDHAENARFFKETFGAKIAIGRAESEWLASGKTPMPHGTNPVTAVISAVGNLAATRFAYDGCAAELPIDGAHSLRDFGFDSHILPTPGHTAGSISVIVDGEVAVCGDALFGIFPGSAYPPFADDGAALVSSWGALLSTGCGLFLPAHGGAVSRETLWKDYEKRRG